jgi:hypothetical protein
MKVQLQLFALFVSCIFTNSTIAQNMGIKLTAGTTPNTTLDINGSIAFREGTARNITTATTNDLVIDSMSHYRITTSLTAAFTITGFTNGQNGRVLTLYNATAYNMTLAHQTTSIAANQIITGTGANIVIGAGGTATLQYNATLSRWLCTGTTGLVATVPTNWSLTGNSGTVDGTNYIGTTDNIPLSIRINNQRSGYIDIATGSTFLGYQAGLVNTGTRNTFMGYLAGTANTTGGENTAVGELALTSNTTGLQNTAVGQDALRFNTSGLSNTGIGESALELNTTGSYNVGLGHEVLATNSIGNNNVAVGSQALEYNVTAGQNIAVGFQVLQTQSFNNGGVSWDSDNVGIGHRALFSNQPTSNTSGYRNVGIGTRTLVDNTTGSGNVALGYEAGNNITTGSNNTFIGYNTDASSVALTNATAIGANAVVNANNSLILGNNANVGIGTSTPAQTLDMGSRTDSVIMPRGTTAQRPATPQSGMMRYNTSLGRMEYYNGTSWVSL